MQRREILTRSKLLRQATYTTIKQKFPTWTRRLHDHFEDVLDCVLPMLSTSSASVHLSFATLGCCAWNSFSRRSGYRLSFFIWGIMFCTSYQQRGGTRSGEMYIYKTQSLNVNYKGCSSLDNVCKVVLFRALHTLGTNKVKAVKLRHRYVLDRWYETERQRSDGDRGAHG
jgi:hypothetical protein